MYSGSVAPTGLQSPGSAAAIACSQMQVTADDQGGRCPRVLQDDAAPWLWLHSPIARSRMGLYSTIRLTSTPQEAGITTLAAAMGSASSRGETAGHHRVHGAHARSGGHSDYPSGIIGGWMITRRQARDTVMETRESSAGRRRPARPVRSADQRSVML